MAKLAQEADPKLSGITFSYGKPPRNSNSNTQQQPPGIMVRFDIYHPETTAEFIIAGNIMEHGDTTDTTPAIDPIDLLSGGIAALVRSSFRSVAAKIAVFTFRGDARPPSTIFSKGFSARGSSMDIFAHALDNTRPPSAFISTSKSADIAAGFGDNIYVVRPRGGIDVNQVLGSRSPFPSELEIAVPWRINPSDIRGLTLPNERMSLLNPNWAP